MPLQRAIISVLLVLAAALLLLGALFFPWWTGALESGYFEIDLRGMTMCLAAGCSESKALSAADSGGQVWAKIGTSTFAASLVAAALLVLSAFRTLVGGHRGKLHWITMAMSVFVGVLGLLFVWRHPELGDWSPTYGVACTLAGALIGASVALLAMRLPRSQSR